MAAIPWHSSGPIMPAPELFIIMTEYPVSLYVCGKSLKQLNVVKPPWESLSSRLWTDSLMEGYQWPTNPLISTVLFKNLRSNFIYFYHLLICRPPWLILGQSSSHIQASAGGATQYPAPCWFPWLFDLWHQGSGRPSQLSQNRTKNEKVNLKEIFLSQCCCFYCHLLYSLCHVYVWRVSPFFPVFARLKYCKSWSCLHKCQHSIYLN